MPTPQEQYDEAMFDFSQAEYGRCAEKLTAILAQNPEYFEAQLALGMALYRQENYSAAIVEGHKAENMRPKDQLVHTNLSLFYMKAGAKEKAEHHGLQARIAGWRENMTPPESGIASDPELQIARTATPPPKSPPIPAREMPWKKKPAAASGSAGPSATTNGSDTK